MSKILNIIATILLLWSCDKVDNNSYLKPYSPIEGEATNQCVLLEEYTGMQCVNCPAAAQQASQLKEIFGQRLITVAIHAGAFAVPSGIFTRDLRTEAGNTYFSTFSFAGTPTGMVNRNEYDNSLSIKPSRWAAAIKQELARVSPIEISLSGQCDPQTRTLTTQCKLKGDRGDLQLLLWLVEDSIATPQIVPSGLDRNYMQRHVLRASINGVWGEVFRAQNESVEHSFLLPEDCNMSRCSVVAIVTKKDSKDIIQVAECKLAMKTL